MSESKKRRSPEQVVASMQDPADAAVYLSARIKACQATEAYLYELCPEQARDLLDQLVKPLGS